MDLKRSSLKIKLRLTNADGTIIDFRTASVSKAESEFVANNLFQGDVPSQLIVAIVSCEAFSGSYRRSLFNFNNSLALQQATRFLQQFEMADMILNVIIDDFERNVGGAEQW